jgi:uncharacterized membrane protein YqjE
MSNSQAFGRPPEPGRGADARRGRRLEEGARPAGTPEGLGTIVGEIVADLQDIVRGEVQLAKTELKEDATKAGRGIAFIAGGAIVLIIGFAYVMLGVIYLLAKAMPMWVAAGIVGIVLLIIGAALAWAGKDRLSATSLAPEQAIESLKEDQEWANRQIKSVRK